MAGPSQLNSPLSSSLSPSPLSDHSPAPLASPPDTSPCGLGITHAPQTPALDESLQKHSPMSSYNQFGASLHPEHHQIVSSHLVVPEDISDNFTRTMQANVSNLRSTDGATAILDYDVTNPTGRTHRPAQNSRFSQGTAMRRSMVHPESTHPMQYNQDSMAMAIQLYRSPNGMPIEQCQVMESNNQSRQAHHEHAVLDNSYAYCYDRGNGEYTRLIPADMLPPLRDIPAIQGNNSGMIVVPQPRGAPPNGPSSNTERVFLQAGSSTRHGDIQSKIDGILNNGFGGFNGAGLVKQHHHSGGGRPSHKKDKIYCDKWVHEGICAFTQQGCRYKHEMPSDKATLQSLGLCNGFPTWWKKKLAEENKQRCEPPRPVRARDDQGPNTMVLGPYVQSPPLTTAASSSSAVSSPFSSSVSPSAEFNSRILPSLSRYQARDAENNLDAKVAAQLRPQRFPAVATTTRPNDTSIATVTADNANGSIGTPQFQRGYPLFMQPPREYNLSDMGEDGTSSGGGVSLASTAPSPLSPAGSSREEGEVSSNPSTSTTIRGGFNVSQPFNSSFGANVSSNFSPTMDPATPKFTSRNGGDSRGNRMPTGNQAGGLSPIAPPRLIGGGLEHSRHRSSGDRGPSSPQGSRRQALFHRIDPGATNTPTAGMNGNTHRSPYAGPCSFQHTER